MQKFRQWDDNHDLLRNKPLLRTASLSIQLNKLMNNFCKTAQMCFETLFPFSFLIIFSV